MDTRTANVDMHPRLKARIARIATDREADIVAARAAIMIDLSQAIDTLRQFALEARHERAELVAEVYEWAYDELKKMHGKEACDLERLIAVCRLLQRMA